MLAPGQEIVKREPERRRKTGEMPQGFSNQSMVQWRKTRSICGRPEFDSRGGGGTCFFSGCFIRGLRAHHAGGPSSNHGHIILFFWGGDEERSSEAAMGGGR